MKPLKRSFKTCLGCPYQTYTTCRLSTEVRAGEGFKRPRHIEPSPHKRGTRPPDWCPLRKRPVLIVLVGGAQP